MFVWATPLEAVLLTIFQAPTKNASLIFSRCWMMILFRQFFAVAVVMAFRELLIRSISGILKSIRNGLSAIVILLSYSITFIRSTILLRYMARWQLHLTIMVI